MPRRNKEDLNLLKKMPWITRDGSLDLTKFVIDSVLKQALSAEIEVRAERDPAGEEWGVWNDFRCDGSQEC